MRATAPVESRAGRGSSTSAVDRVLAVGGIVGVVGFVAAWAIGGLTVDDYSMVDDAISQLAAVGSPVRWWMTAGFVAFGVGVTLFAQALRSSLGGAAWIAATITALATVGVAATPLGRFDRAHDVFAAIGYLSLAATPLLASRELRRRGAARAARWSVACGIATAALLVASITVDANGLTQRLGLGITDLWIVAAAMAILRRSSAPAPQAAVSAARSPASRRPVRRAGTAQRPRSASRRPLRR